MKPVEKKMAKACIDAYTAKESGKKSKITTGIGFDAKKLAAWVNSVAKNSAEIQIRFGIYTDEYAPEKRHTGRTTVFLCACDENGNDATDEEGNEIPPLNSGDPYP